MTYTAKLTRTAEATLWVHVTGECAHELEVGEEVAFGLISAAEPMVPESVYDAALERIAELERMTEEREADMHVRIREGYDKTVADAWRAKVAELECQLASRTGPYCAHCGGQHLGTECRMRAAEVERDESRARIVELERERSDTERATGIYALVGKAMVTSYGGKTVEDLCADTIVDRICAAVTFDSGHYPLDMLMIGKLPVAVIVDGPGFVHRVRDEIRKAAKG
jgi:hypothetical protein